MSEQVAAMPGLAASPPGAWHCGLRRRQPRRNL